MDRRNGRRRRVLRDEARTEENSKVEKKKAANALAYNESALEQPALTDLIPVHPLRALTLVLGSLTALVGLLVLDDWSAASGIASFQLDKPGSLASWFASTLLMWAAAGALLTYLIRRHRNDDYRGAYHIWIWAAVMLVLASVSATTPWHRHWNDGLARLTGLPLGEHGWWLSTLGVLAAAMMIRVAIDARACRTALGMMAAAAIGYTVVGLLATHTLPISEYEMGDLACHFGLLASHLTLAHAIWWNARHVQLDAQGVHAERAAKRLAAKQAREESKNQKREAKLAAKQQKQAKRSETEGEEDDEADTNDGSQSKPSRKTKKSAKPKQEPQASPPSEEEADEEPDTLKLDRSLSKSERRRQRKQKRRAA